MLRGCLRSRWLGRHETGRGAKPAVRLVSLISRYFHDELVSYTLEDMLEGKERRCGESPDQVDARQDNIA